MHLYLNWSDKLVLRLRINLWTSMVLVGKIVKTLEEIQGHILYFIKVVQLTTANKFQDQFLNQVQKASKMKHALQEWL